MKFDFHPEARKEFDEAFDWYAEREPEAARRFEAEVNTAISAIAANPQRFAKHVSGHRYRMLHRFPYLIVYRATANSIVIVAVAHASRRPGYWSDRG